MIAFLLTHGDEGAKIRARPLSHGHSHAVILPEERQELCYVIPIGFDGVVGRALLCALCQEGFDAVMHGDVSKGGRRITKTITKKRDVMERGTMGFLVTLSL